MRNIRITWLALVVVGIFGGLIILSFCQTDSGFEYRRGGVPLNEVDDPGGRFGAWVDEVVFTQEADAGKVVHQIDSGRFDLYASGINNPTVYNRIRESPGTDYSISYGSSVELTLNPAVFIDEDRLNPFSRREIREAMNWLLDRDYIAAELFGGLAVPRYLPMSTVFPDYARLAETARTLELRYLPDQARAERIIEREMESLGAQRQKGLWHYRGRPVELNIIIRTEDARREFGDYLSNLMEKLGFRVQRMYRTAAESSRLWIATDPAQGGWHLYTGGWAAVVINRDLAGELDFFYTSRGRPEPLWQSYTPDPELDKLAERLQRRDYESWEERQQMMARGLELALRESTRVWLVDQKSVWAHAPSLQFTTDLAAGFSGSAWWPYTLRFTDRIGGRVMVGVPGLLTEPWNMVAGTNWLFDRMITRSLGDSVVLPDPFTGLYRPQRLQSAEVTVRQGIPVNRTLDWVHLKEQEEIPVPGDSWIDWDREQEKFVTVAEKLPEGTTARTRTRVVYEEDYLRRRWHDGSPVSMADILLPWILLFERADPESPLFDRSARPIFDSFITHFRGFRIVSEKPLTVEIFSDQIFPDAEWIVGSRAFGSSPWHVLMVGILADQAGRLAFSSDKADQLGVEWMNLVSGPSLAILDQKLARARAANLVPYPRALGPYIDEDEAAARYRALAEWRNRRGHYWVDNGPFYLHAVRPVENSVVLRRYRDFPDRADKWLRLDRPDIPELELTGPNLVKAGEAVEFNLRISLRDQPYPPAALERLGYMLFDRDERLVAEGEIRPETGQAGVWSILLEPGQTAELEPGASSLEVAVSSRRVALPSFTSYSFPAVPGEVPGSPELDD